MEFVINKCNQASKKQIVLATLIINAVSTLLVFILVGMFGRKNAYLTFGPSEVFVFLGIAIDSWLKYAALLFVIAVLQLTNVIYIELGSTIIAFNVYDPNVKEIEGFTKMELQLFTNVGFLINGIRSVLMVLLSISQIDVALFSTIIFEVYCIFTVRFLLNRKTFVVKNENESELV